MELIAQGAEGAVYKLNDTTAKKVVDIRGQKYNEEYERYGEIRFIQDFKSPYFVPVKNIQENSYEMPLLKACLGGYDFIDSVTVQAIGGVEKVIDWLNGLLVELTTLKLYHHDINPYNIMVDDNNRLYLIDFGWASDKKIDKYPPQLNEFYSTDQVEAINQIKKEIYEAFK